ncbi:cell division protein FtsZ [Candidatus Uhrbacteria bacterium RIFCSPLOWO2_02_FULL_51_9]|uniref:Cell division protein FtsZ n=1 Tax=Candidatus Uhrbacteria bacterium RIFCSPLOWO2_02_FULL_51_9 TaxID=1802410 RepID=A0A1F7VDU6_9BACT|nr:MAG: cell division protein FtsZ [Candidatus Uhrbacteria bacterium RIFCSPLOWO2_02_FULL_51_9]
MPEVKPEIEGFAKIAVVGIGGSGNSAVNRMIDAKIRGVEFIAVNTDLQALHQSQARVKLNIGKGVTRGLGAGMDPEVGRRAAEESQNEVRDLLKDKDMVFITCGLGGGTGSGAAPLVAQLARDAGALTVAVVTKPFGFEGAERKAIAEQAHEKLRANVDTIITIPNDRVLHIIDKKTSLLEAFRMVDDVLRQGVQGISEVITIPGNVNVDFADVRTIMTGSGSALMGIGQASGDNRAVEAAKQAISSPLLDLSIDGARGILMVISGGESMGMQEMQEASKLITSSADENARVIWGAVVDPSLKDDIKITVIATGFEGASRRNEPVREEEREYTSASRSLKPTRSAPVSSNIPVVDLESDELPEPVVRKPIGEAKARFEKTDEEEELEIPAFIRRKMNG